jgi:hypothetical protein
MILTTIFLGRLNYEIIILLPLFLDIICISLVPVVLITLSGTVAALWLELLFTFVMGISTGILNISGLFLFYFVLNNFKFLEKWEFSDHPLFQVQC